MSRTNKGWGIWTEASGDKWRCRWQGKYGKGQHIFSYKKDADELTEKRKRNFQRQDAGLPPLLLTLPPNFDKFKNDYIGWLGPRKAERTVYLAKRSLSLWEEFAGNIFPVLEKTQLEFGGRTVTEFCDWLLKDKNPNHARIILRSAKAAFRQAYKKGIIDYDPFLHFEMPSPVSVARVLKPEEIKMILEKLPLDCKRAFCVVLFTGLRMGEITRLDWSGIRKENEKWYMTVLKSKTRRAKPETKTQALHPMALMAMGEPKKAGRVFDLTESYFQHRLRSVVKKLALGRVRWHDLRHTWATTLMQQYRDLRAVMDAGGWATHDAAMIYQHATDKRTDATLALNYDIPPIGPLKGEKSRRRKSVKMIEK